MLFPQRLKSDAPEKFYYAKCGDGFSEATQTGIFLNKLQQKKSYWGKLFPKAREKEKAARGKVMRQK